MKHGSLVGVDRFWENRGVQICKTESVCFPTEVSLTVPNHNHSLECELLLTLGQSSHPITEPEEAWHRTCLLQNIQQYSGPFQPKRLALVTAFLDYI